MNQIESLTGQSAEKILNNKTNPPDQQCKAAIQAAEILWSSKRSSWRLGEIYQDGTTVWISPEETQKALVAPDGFLNIIYQPDRSEW